VSEEKGTDVGPSGIEVAYERIGGSQAPPVLLIMGAGRYATGHGCRPASAVP
jgi:hypothetical protein